MLNGQYRANQLLGALGIFPTQFEMHEKICVCEVTSHWLVKRANLSLMRWAKGVNFELSRSASFPSLPYMVSVECFSTI